MFNHSNLASSHTVTVDVNLYVFIYLFVYQHTLIIVHTCVHGKISYTEGNEQSDPSIILCIHNRLNL